MRLRGGIQDALWWMAPERETIGASDCPLVYRWTLLDRLDVRLMVHYFLPNASDPDCHDHPRPFITAILRGSYEDIAPCAQCSGSGREKKPHYVGQTFTRCDPCEGSGLVIREVMRPGMIRRRSARHTHLTRTGDEGCWTIVLMGPKRRPWGFLRRGEWWPFRHYEEVFGSHMRCDSESGELVRNAKPLTLADIDRASELLGFSPPPPPAPGPPRPPQPPNHRPMA